jgi:hypothetical protein
MLRQGIADLLVANDEDRHPNDSQAGRSRRSHWVLWLSCFRHLSLRMTLPELETLFHERGIDYQTPGFYDSPRFLAAEQRDASFLDRYAEYVDRRQYEPAYLDRIRDVVPRLSAFIYRHLLEEGRLGACIDVSGMVARMLDLEGIWAYAVGGGVTVNFPVGSGVQPSHFGVIGGESNVAAHMWVKAPPFVVVDISLPEQQWGAARQGYFTNFVITETSRFIPVTVEQLVDMNAYDEFVAANGRRPTMRDVARRIPHAFPFMERFPSFSVVSADLTVDYAPTKVGASLEPLAEMAHPRLNGHSPIELYRLFKQENAD